MLKPGWLLLILIALSQNSFARATADYWKCENRISGSWEFALAPYACDADSFGEDETLIHRYGKQVFNIGASRATERARYMNEVYAVIRDASGYYIKRRKPRVSGIEVMAFRQAMLTIAHQESFWSHYRETSGGKLKFMRGDSGHGHGMMQIDDRYHFVRIETGEAWDLIGNLRLSLEIYFQEWERAATASCVGGADKFEQRTRAAYSAYNGGPSQLCRWAKASNPHREKDEGFYSKWKTKAWEKVITDTNRKLSFDAGCVLDNGENCFGETQISKVTAFIGLKDGVRHACVSDSSGISCVNSERDLACLSNDSLDLTDVKPQGEKALDAAAEIQDRHQVCASVIDGLANVGSRLTAIKNVHLRATPGGGSLGVISRGAYLDVIDFEVRNDQDLSRYYKVETEDGKIGWVFGASEVVGSELVAVKDSRGGSRVIALGKAHVTEPSGINLRKTAGGEKIGVLPLASRIDIRDFLVRGADNEVYLSVQSARGSGWIYSGKLLPKSTLTSWVRGDEVVP